KRDEEVQGQTFCRQMRPFGHPNRLRTPGDGAFPTDGALHYRDENGSRSLGLGAKAIKENRKAAQGRLYAIWGGNTMILRGHIFSQVLEMDTGLTIVAADKFLPHGPHKVVYLLHGLCGNSESWADYTMLPAYADKYDALFVLP